jgi:hypothetical protein
MFHMGTRQLLLLLLQIEHSHQLLLPQHVTLPVLLLHTPQYWVPYPPASCCCCCM